MWSLRFSVLSLQALCTKGRDSEVQHFNLCDAEGVLTSRQIGKEATGKQKDSPLPAASSPRMRLGGVLSLAGRVSGLGCPRLVLDVFQLAWSFRPPLCLWWLIWNKGWGPALYHQKYLKDQSPWVLGVWFPIPIPTVWSLLCACALYSRLDLGLRPWFSCLFIL